MYFIFLLTALLCHLNLDAKEAAREDKVQGQTLDAESVLSLPKLSVRILENHWELKLEQLDLELQRLRMDEVSAATGLRGEVQHLTGLADAPKWDESAGLQAWGPQNSKGQYIGALSPGGAAITVANIFKMQIMYPLYTFGAATFLAEAASKNFQAHQLGAREKENKVLLQACLIYTSLALSYEIEAFLNEIKENLNKALTQMKASSKQNQVDLYTLEVAKLTLEKEMNSFELKRLQGWYLLKLFMGVSPEQKFVLADQGLPSPALNKPDSAGEIWASAQNSRPEFGQIDLGLEALNSLVQAQSRARFPIIMAGGILNIAVTPGRTHPQNPFIMDPFNQVIPGLGLALYWDLNLASKNVEIAKSEINIQKLQASKSFAEKAVQLEIANKIAELTEAQKRYHSYDDMKKLTFKWVRYALLNNDLGVLETRKLVDALLAYIDSKKNYLEAKLNLFQKQFELIVVKGDSLADKIKEQKTPI